MFDDGFEKAMGQETCDERKGSGSILLASGTKSGLGPFSNDVLAAATKAIEKPYQSCQNDLKDTVKNGLKCTN
jgi:hypothetical protein